MHTLQHSKKGNWSCLPPGMSLYSSAWMPVSIPHALLALRKETPTSFATQEEERQMLFARSLFQSSCSALQKLWSFITPIAVCSLLAMGTYVRKGNRNYM